MKEPTTAWTKAYLPKEIRDKEKFLSRPGCSVVKWTGGFVGRSRTRMSGGRGE